MGHSAGSNFLFDYLAGTLLGETASLLASAVINLVPTAGMYSFLERHALSGKPVADAGLNADHELVMTGHYRFVRHPIYASMLCLFCGTAAMITPLLLFLPALLVFIVGTEVRVRVEDALLASRFGGQFGQFKSSVPAYVPFLR